MNHLQTLWKFCVTAWGGIGPLVGVLVGAWMTRSWQRKQWVLENKKAEYRELISTLSKSYHYLVAEMPDPNSSAIIAKPASAIVEEDRVLRQHWVAGLQIIADRVFIDKEVRDAKIYDQWYDIWDSDSEKINEKWKALHQTLVRIAHQGLGIE